MKKLEEKVELKIIELYKLGKSMKFIGNELGLNATTVFNVLKRNSVQSRTKGGINELPADLIINKYREGHSCQEIANDLNVTFHTISNILEKYGIRRNNRYKNKSLNIDYFSKIDTYDKAYFLGFLITDGNISGNAVRLSLSIKDKDILNIFKSKLNSSNKLYYRKSKPEVIISNKSNKMVNDLALYGVIPNKTGKEYIPSIDTNLISHLFRGLLDGDGWISSKSHQLGFCGSKICVTQFRDFLVKTLNVYNVAVLQTQPHLWQVSWASKRDIIHICEYIYADKKDCFLDRKYQEFLKIQGNTEVSNYIAKG
jgi:hypothetical protein